LRFDLFEAESSKCIAALAKLEHLQQFVYHHTEIDDHQDHQYFGYCLRLMPRLTVSGMRIKIQLVPDELLTSFATLAFENLNGPLPTSQLALRQLCLVRSSEMPVGVALPDLETLYLIKPGPSFSLLGFSSLTELGLEEMNLQLFEQILDSIGHQLLSLAVSVRDTLFVDRVFRMCPKLQKFYITDLPVDFVGQLVPIEAQKCLTEFGFGEKDFQIRCRFQPEHLLQLLQALPNLQVWSMRIYLFSKQECTLISKALEQKSILQYLQQFHHLANAYDDDEDVSVDDMEYSDLVVQCMIDHCPNLSRVKLSRSDNLEYF
jgi:hypothetical protein